MARITEVSERLKRVGKRQPYMAPAAKRAYELQLMRDCHYAAKVLSACAKATQHMSNCKSALIELEQALKA